METKGLYAFYTFFFQIFFHLWLVESVNVEPIDTEGRSYVHLLTIQDGIERGASYLSLLFIPVPHQQATSTLTRFLLSKDCSRNLAPEMGLWHHHLIVKLRNFLLTSKHKTWSVSHLAAPFTSSSSIWWIKTLFPGISLCNFKWDSISCPADAQGISGYPS